MKKKSLLLALVLLVTVSNNNSIGLPSKTDIYNAFTFNVNKIVSPDMYSVWLAALSSEIVSSTSNNKNNTIGTVCPIVTTGLLVAKAINLETKKDKSLMDYVLCAVPFFTVFAVKALGVSLKTKLRS